MLQVWYLLAVSRHLTGLMWWRQPINARLSRSRITTEKRIKKIMMVWGSVDGSFSSMVYSTVELGWNSTFLQCHRIFFGNRKWKGFVMNQPDPGKVTSKNLSRVKLVFEPVVLCRQQLRYSVNNKIHSSRQAWEHRKSDFLLPYRWRIVASS